MKRHKHKHKVFETLNFLEIGSQEVPFQSPSHAYPPTPADEESGVEATSSDNEESESGNECDGQ